jgi:hypothetical protein
MGWPVSFLGKEYQMATRTKPKIVYVEAPASFNTHYVNPAGFVCQLTLRSDNEIDLLEKVNATLSHLIEQGNLPFENNNHHPNNDVKLCAIHNAEMRRREKDGRYWYSHQMDDGSWCWGRQANKEVIP